MYNQPCEGKLLTMITEQALGTNNRVSDLCAIYVVIALCRISECVIDHVKVVDDDHLSRSIDKQLCR
jgi:hypothetical protein